MNAKLVVPGIHSPPKLSQQGLFEARRHVDNLTKPVGSLGVLEDIALLLATIFSPRRPATLTPRALIFAADHGVSVTHRVSAYPTEVTRQMLSNFASGGAAASVLARAVGVPLTVINCGVAGFSKKDERIRQRVIREGTRDMSVGPAMTASEAEEAICLGMNTVEEFATAGDDLFAIGEIGIGNTTSASAITSVMCDSDPLVTVGRGTGVSRSGLAEKRRIVRRSIEVNKPSKSKPAEVLAKLGGLEIAAMAGAIIRAAQLRCPVIIDGFVSTAAAIVANAIAPGVRDYLIAAHLSPEPGHSIQLANLRLTPILSLRMRLGEATGAILSVAVVQAAWAMYCEMATFEEARVSGPVIERIAREAGSLSKKATKIR